MTEILLKVALNTIKPKKKNKKQKTKTQINKQENEQALQLYHQFNHKINVHIAGLLLSSEICTKYKTTKEAQVFAFTYIRITF